MNPVVYVARMDNHRAFGRKHMAEFLEEFVHAGKRERARVFERWADMPPISGGSQGGSLYTIPNTSLALSASATASVLQVAPGAHALEVSEWYLGFDGSSAQTAITVELWRSDGSTAGTSTSKTPVKENETDGAADASGAVNFTVEPTVLTVIKGLFVPPSSSVLVQSPLGRGLGGKSSGLKLGARVTTQSGVTPHCLGYLEFCE